LAFFHAPSKVACVEAFSMLSGGVEPAGLSARPFA
jgi:hypothetical protein